MSQEQAALIETEHTNDEDVTRLAISEAIERRAATQTHDDDEERRFAMERDIRQKFRRLVDPGISRHTQPIQFEATVKMISTIANNLLSDTENEKFRRFKPTNSLIKKNLVEVKGALEYLVELGFRAEVENFQPYYIFIAIPRNLDNLRIGAAVLTETLDRINEKAEHAKLNRVDPKAVQREIALKVKLAYEDDRKEKKRRDELEKQVREARAARVAAAKAAGTASPSSPDHISIAENEEDGDDLSLMSPMPSRLRMSLRGGQTLAGNPPSYASEEAEGTSDSPHN